VRALTQRNQLVMEMETAGKRIAAAIDGLTEEQASQQTIDGWSVKDHLNHMCHWHEMRALEIMRISRGGMASMQPLDDDQVEEINQPIVRLRRRLALKQVIADLEFARGLVLEAIQNCPEEALDESKYEELAMTGAGHDMDHAEAIEAWRKKEGI
jgi:hypothetical protein